MGKLQLEILFVCVEDTTGETLFHYEMFNVRFTAGMRHINTITTLIPFASIGPLNIEKMPAGGKSEQILMRVSFHIYLYTDICRKPIWFPSMHKYIYT